MSYPINQKINPYTQASMGANSPQLQNIDANTIESGIANNSVLKGVSSSSDNDENKNFLITAGLTVPVWAAMVYGMSKFNDACKNTDYSKTVVGKVGEFGERIGNGKFFQSSFMKKVEKIITSAKTKFFEKIVPKSRILTAFFNTPAVPKSSMVVTTAKGTIAGIASDAAKKLDQYSKHGHKIVLDGKELSAKEIEELSKTSHEKETIDKIVKICEGIAEKQTKDGPFEMKKVGKIPWSEKFSASKSPKYITDIPGAERFLGKKIHFAEYANKLKAFSNGNKTWLGKSLPTTMLKVIEGLTNGTAGGKIAILMGAYFVADAIKKTMDAPSGHGEKRKTFAENLIYNVGWYLTMPLGIGLLYKAGGLKYIGMSKEKVDAYRKELEEFNKKAEAGDFANKEAYKTAKKNLKGMLKGDISGSKPVQFFKNLLYKPLKKAASILDVGLETAKPFIPKGTDEAGKFFKTLGYNLKRGAGYPMRFIPYMFVIAPFLGKLAAICSHIVFGKPTKSVLDEDKEPEKEQQRQIISPIMPQQQTQAQTPVPPMNTAMQPAQQNTNLSYSQPNIGEYKTEPTTGRQMISSPEAPAKRYIPSSEPVKIDPNYRQLSGEQDAKMNSAIKKADYAERNAGKFVKEKKD